MRDVKNKPLAKRGVSKNTSRIPSFVQKARRLLASSVVLLSDAVLSAVKMEISKDFAKALVRVLVDLIKNIPRS